MRLKSLTLNAFKSFADKTVFEFHPGVTGIVGPNGCGKSNVVDAIRWVLGEKSAKALRGGEMADVIFNGTDKRQPLGMAEVTLTLTDCESALGMEYNEMSISRRVARDGKSGYAINGQNCRLRDIQDLLMDTGVGQMAYSVMEQGKIDMLLSSKPEDRRAVFEEAAGITKFKTQKKEALRKLDYTEANLVRIADIIAEVVRQKNSLQRQAAKARRYQTLMADVSVLDTHLSHRRYEELQAAHSELDTSAKSLQAEENALRAKIETAETDISQAREKFQQLEEEFNETRNRGTSLQNKVQAATDRIGFNAERTRELSSLIENSDADIQATRDKHSAQENEIQSAAQALTQIADAISSQQSRLEEQEAKYKAVQQNRQEAAAALGKLRQQATEDESTLVNVRAQLSSRLSQIDTDSLRKEQLITELAKLESERNARVSEKDALVKQLAEAKSEIEKHQATVQEAEAGFKEAEASTSKLRAELDGTLRELSKKTSRLEVLKGLLAKGEGLEKGTQSVLKGLDNPDFFKGGIRGVLTSFLEVEQDSIPAIEAAIGSHLQTVLVADTMLAEAVIDTLTNKKLGSAAILPQNLLDAPAPPADRAVPQGATAWAFTKVNAQAEVAPLIQRLLADVLIVPDLKTALELKKNMPETSFATSSGEYVSAHGVVHGGSSSKGGAASVLQRQNEIKSLETETADLTTKRDHIETQLTSLKERSAELRSQLEEARSYLQENRVTESTVAGQLGVLDREVTQMASKLDGVKWEQGELFNRLESAETSITELKRTEEDTAASLEKRRTEIAERDSAQSEITRHEEEAHNIFNELRTSLAVELRSRQALEQQSEPMKHRLGELQELVARREADIATHKEKIATAEGETQALQESIERHQADLEIVESEISALAERRQSDHESLRETEQALLEDRRKIDKAVSQRNKEEVKITQLDLRIENLQESILERYDCDLTVFEADTHALLGAITSQKQSAKRSSAQKARHDEDPNEEPEAPIAENRVAEAIGEEAVEEIVAKEEAPEEPKEPLGDIDKQIEAEMEEMRILEEGPDWEFVESIIGDLKRKLDSMGPVNLDAIAEFEELEERHGFLVSQHDDLVNSKDELLRVIDKINTTTEVLFSETFAEVRKNFQGTFKELFGKGAQADLMLMDESDPLECGIDIIARPPGKKPTSITLLSGGERSMTAVALLFSIFMVKPSPFCVLDELDAPLDESNIGRFLKMLDRFIDRSQFIIVTHNKRTMSRADIIFGVTQQEYGISKLVSMKLEKNKENDRKEIEEAPEAVAR